MVLLFRGNYCAGLRDLYEVICGVCGIIGEVYLGDGNERTVAATKM